MASRIEWHRITRSTFIVESVQFLLALLALAFGRVSFPQLVLLLMVELLLTTVLTSPFYRERGVSKHVFDLLKMVFLCGFCGIFLFAAYAGANGFRNGLTIEPIGFAVLAVLLTLRVSMLARQAWHSANRRLTWTREALRRGAVLYFTLFLAAFTCVIPGLPLAMLLTPLWPDVAADLGIGANFLLVQGGLALTFATMSDKELGEISEHPYLD